MFFRSFFPAIQTYFLQNRKEYTLPENFTQTFSVRAGLQQNVRREALLSLRTMTMPRIHVIMAISTNGMGNARTDQLNGLLIVGLSGRNGVFLIIEGEYEEMVSLSETEKPLN